MRDFETLLPVFRELHTITPFKDTPMDEGHMRRTFALVTSMPVFFAEVSVNEDDKPVGFLAGGVDKNQWGIKIASDILVLPGRETDKLINNFRTWALKNGAEEVVMTEVTNNPRYKKLLKRCGFYRIGTVYLKGGV